MSNLTPWNIYDGPEPPARRYKNLIQARDWYAVYPWSAEESPDVVELDFVPVIAWAIKLADEDDEEIVAILSPEDDGYTDEASGDHRPEVFCRGAQMNDPGFVARMKARGKRSLESKREGEERFRKTVDYVQAFVMSQPDPEAFAARMRNAGATGPNHAYSAIMLAGDSADRAVELVRLSPIKLAAMLFEARRQNPSA